jgi:hypothetical protein
MGVSDIEKQRLSAALKCLLKGLFSACVSAQLNLRGSAGLKRPLKVDISKVLSLLPNRLISATLKAALKPCLSMLLSMLLNAQISATLKLVLKRNDSTYPRVHPRVHLQVHPEGRESSTQTPKAIIHNYGILYANEGIIRGRDHIG